jgi:hypothetical protein
MTEKSAEDLEELVQLDDAEEERTTDPEEYEPDATVSADTGTVFEETGEPASTPQDATAGEADDEGGAP